MSYAEAVLNLLERGYDLVRDLTAKDRAIFKSRDNSLFKSRYAYIGSIDATGGCAACAAAELTEEVESI